MNEGMKLAVSGAVALTVFCGAVFLLISTEIQRRHRDCLVMWADYHPTWSEHGCSIIIDGKRTPTHRISIQVGGGE